MIALCFFDILPPVTSHIRNLIQYEPLGTMSVQTKTKSGAFISEPDIWAEIARHLLSIPEEVHWDGLATPTGYEPDLLNLMKVSKVSQVPS